MSDHEAQITLLLRALVEQMKIQNELMKSITKSVTGLTEEIQRIKEDK